MDIMNVDTTTQTLPVKATFMQTTIRFDLPSRTFESLRQELSKRLPGFENVNYVDDEDDQVRMSSDEELLHAVTLSKGVLRLVLASPTEAPSQRKCRAVRKPEDKIRKFLQRRAPERFAELEPKLLSLNEFGFYCCQRNLKILLGQDGDLEKTIEVLKSEQGKQEERKKRREEKKLQRGLKRKHDGEGKKTRKQRCGEKRRKDRSLEASSDDPSQQFLALANQAFIKLTNDALPGKFTHLFVDGNNMLYLTNKLRQFTLQRKINVSQQILASVTRHFSTLHKFNTELVFDSMNSTAGLSAESEHLENGSTFRVTSAHPEFPTSDAKFVAWARANPEIAPLTLVVTSDRALAGELFTLGVSVTKPGVWLACLAAASASDGNSLDWKEWMDAWIDRGVIHE